MKMRACGVLMPVFALPGGYSCGNFGKSARDFIDFLKQGGFSYWQVLPFTQTDEFHSPYASSSAFSVNPLFIDLEQLEAEGLLTSEELDGAKERVSYTCEYDRLAKERIPLLALAASRFQDGEALDTYLSEHPKTEEYCRFEALKAANGGVPWQKFTTLAYDETVYRTYAFIAYTFEKQWNALHDYAKEKGIGIIGDLPIYVSFDSSDVYFHPEDFHLDKNGDPKGVAGVPPDYFCEDGQMWGNPLYNWAHMKKDDFSFWRARMRHTLSIFDGVRLDHFRGFESYYEIPFGAPNAREGIWKNGPRRAFVDMLKQEQKDRLLIAEDLGCITPEVEALLSYSGFPGMRVLAFAMDGEASPHLPHNYPKNSVAYSGTHDNNTLLGFLMALPSETRRAIYAYCRYFGDNIGEGCRAAIETLYSSHADLIILPIQDLLFYGEDTRFNTPGKAEGNWAYRVTKEQLKEIDTAYFLALAKRYGRI